MSCGDVQIPSPQLYSRIEDVEISDATTTIDTNNEYNSYTCYCNVQIPLNCVSGGCGIFGTSINENYCNTGTRPIRVCIPQSFNFNPELDCQTRVRTLLLFGLRYIYRYCNGTLNVCNIRIGCTSIRTDNSIMFQYENRCSRECPHIPFYATPEMPYGNYFEATMISTEYQLGCENQTQFTDTENVCLEL